MLFWPAVFLPTWLLHLWSAHRHYGRLQRATKPLLLLLLLVWYFTGSPTPRAVVWLALLMGLAGDVLLMLPECLAGTHAPVVGENLFLAGLGAFLAGHVAYGAAFLGMSGSRGLPAPWVFLVMLVPVLAGIWVYHSIHTCASEPRPVLIAYICVIAGMNMAAILAAWANPGPYSLLPILGGLLFLVSDAALSLSRYGVRSFSDTFVMATYGLAQALLTGWFILMDGGRLL